MPSIYARGEKLWCRLKGTKVPGKWGDAATPYYVGDETKARRFADEAQRLIDERNQPGAAPRASTTFRQWIARWLQIRAASGHDWKADRGRLENHVMETLGDVPLRAIRTATIAALVRRLRFDTDPPIAQRTVRNIYSVVAAAFRDAAIEELIDVSPCCLTDAQLGPIADADPEWRDGALFTRPEAQILISHPEIPTDRRLTYGFGLLAGLRPGEAGALRWRHYTLGDLGRLLVARSYSVKQAATKGTKTETVKVIPVHTTLAALLDQWLFEYEDAIGHPPTPDDLIIPLPPDVKLKRAGERFRGYDYTGRRWREIDLPMLGWRSRSVYDTKATFITLCQDDGARREVIRDRITHTKPKRTAFDHYDRGPHWEETCRELSKFRMELLSPAASRAAADEIRATLLMNSGSEGGDRTLVRPVSSGDRRPVLVESVQVRPRRYTTPAAASLLHRLVDAAEARDTDGAYEIACEIRRREAKGSAA